MATFEDIAEDLRAASAIPFLVGTGLTEDSFFWKNLGFAFQLHGDPLTGGLPIVFPLVLNPRNYRKRLPFALEIRPVQGGGLIVEGQGIVLGEIQISGNFGFAPKAVDGVQIPLSGQAHFKRLQDLCFKRYSTLKADPTTTESVFLTFHALGDNEHFVVEPREEVAERDAGKTRFTTDYNISLAILGDATAPPPKKPEDDPIISAINNVRAAITKGLGFIVGGLQDIENQPQIASAIRDVQALGQAAIDGIGAVNDAITQVQLVAASAGEFLRGVKRAFDIPLDLVKRADDAVGQIAATLARAENLPADIVQSFRQLQDGLAAIAAYPEKFSEDFDAAARRFLTLTQGPAAAGSVALDAAASSSTQALNGTTALKAGDKERVLSGAYGTRAFPRYQGFIEVVVRVDDTLPLLAARYLKDARRWIDIALTNSLKSPFISDDGLPDTLKAGDKILIPQTAKSSPPPSVRSPGNPVLGTSQYEALLGRDLFVATNADGELDLVVDPGTSTDFLSVAGIDNMKQATNTILQTEKGSNPLFLEIGVTPLVGKKGTFERLIEAHLAIVSGVQRDPRVERVPRVTMSAEGDSVPVDLEIDLIQNIQTRVIGRALS